MSVEPTPREIAFRLLAAFHAGEETYRAFIDDLQMPSVQAGAVIHELVRIAGASMHLVAEHMGVEHDDLMLQFERVIDDAEQRFLEGEA